MHIQIAVTHAPRIQDFSSKPIHPKRLFCKPNFDPQPKNYSVNLNSINNVVKFNQQSTIIDLDANKNPKPHLWKNYSSLRREILHYVADEKLPGEGARRRALSR